MREEGARLWEKDLDLSGGSGGEICRGEKDQRRGALCGGGAGAGE